MGQFIEGLIPIFGVLLAHLRDEARILFLEECVPTIAWRRDVRARSPSVGQELFIQALCRSWRRLWRFGRRGNGFNDRSFARIHAIELGGDLSLTRGDRSVATEPADVAIVMRVVAESTFCSGSALVRKRSHSVTECRFDWVDLH
jgi:hypothetical protein